MSLCDLIHIFAALAGICNFELPRHVYASSARHRRACLSSLVGNHWGRYFLRSLKTHVNSTAIRTWARLSVSDWFSSRSLRPLDVTRLPALVDRGFGRRVQPQDGEVALAGDGGQPVGLLTLRCRRAEIEIRAAIGILRRHVPRAERRERLAIGETRRVLGLV